MYWYDILLSKIVNKKFFENTYNNFLEFYLFC